MNKDFQFNLLASVEENLRNLKVHESEMLPVGKVQERFEGTPILSDVEFEIMHLTLSGVEIKEIALKIYRSVAGVKWRLSQVYYKFNVENRLQLIEKASREGLHFLSENGIKHSFSIDINLQGHLKK